MKISNNTVLQHSAIDSTKAVDIPVILVDKDSKQVSITGNTTHKTPEAVGPQQLAARRLQAVGLDDREQQDRAARHERRHGAAAPAAGTQRAVGAGGRRTTATATPTIPLQRQEHRRQERVVFNNVDFKEGDRIILSNFDNGTFRHYAGDNAMAVNADKTTSGSTPWSTSRSSSPRPGRERDLPDDNDTLVLRIAQDDGTLDIALPGFAAAYKATFNDDLF